MSDTDLRLLERKADRSLTDLFHYRKAMLRAGRGQELRLRRGDLVRVNQFEEYGQGEVRRVLTTRVRIWFSLNEKVGIMPAVRTYRGRSSLIRLVGTSREGLSE